MGNTGKRYQKNWNAGGKGKSSMAIEKAIWQKKKPKDFWQKPLKVMHTLKKKNQKTPPVLMDLFVCFSNTKQKLPGGQTYLKIKSFKAGSYILH